MTQNAAEAKQPEEQKSDTVKASTTEKNSEQKRGTKLGESLAAISKAKKDPFKEADESELKDPDSTKAEFQDAQPTPVAVTKKANRPTNKATKAKTSFAGVLGLIVAIFALAWNYYQDQSLGAYKASIVNELESRDSNIAGLNTRMDEVKVSSNKMHRTVENNSYALSQFEQVPGKVNKIGKNISELRSEIVELQSRVEGNSAAIKENNKTTEELRNYLNMLSKRRVTPSKTASKQPSKKNYNIGHAVLASVDSWGNNINAVLKDESGWVPLGLGDLYQGWKLVGANEEEAIFKKGKKELRLSRQE